MACDRCRLTDLCCMEDVQVMGYVMMVVFHVGPPLSFLFKYFFEMIDPTNTPIHSISRTPSTLGLLPEESNGQKRILRPFSSRPFLQRRPPKPTKPKANNLERVSPKPKVLPYY